MDAAAVASKWGGVIDDSVLHALVQRIGAQAQAQTQERLKTLPTERQPQQPASPLAVLRVDGWQVRQRRAGWGRKKTQQPRVEWHELKTGVFYRHEQSAHTAGGRGLLEEKVVVSWQGEPGELGRRLHWEAVRGGLGRPGPTEPAALGRTPSAPIAPRAGEKGARPNPRSKETPGSGRTSDRTRA